MIGKHGKVQSRPLVARRLIFLLWLTGSLSVLNPPVSAGTAEAQAYASEAAQKLAMGDVARAEILYAQAMQQSPNDVGISMALAELYITQQRFDSAKTLIDTALQTASSDYRPWKAQAIYQRSQGNEAQALRSFERAFSLGGKEDRYVVVNLQQHFEATGNKARKQQMDNLLQALDLSEQR